MNLRTISGVLVIALVSGCDRAHDDIGAITEIREITSSKPRHVGGAGSAARFQSAGSLAGAHGAHGMGGAAPATDESTVSPFTFELPEGWEERAPTQFCLINLRVAAHPETECTVAITGGSIEENLNRWRAQFGLAPLDAGAVAALPRVQILGLDATRLDIQGSYGGMGTMARENYRLIGGLLDLGDGGLFVKLVGPAAVIEEEAARFDPFCASLRARSRDDSPHASDSMAIDPHEGLAATEHAAPSQRFNAESLRWTAPAHWREQEQQMSGYRLVTLTSDRANEVECYITPLAGDGGGLLANVNMWRQQMGLDAIAAAALDDLSTLYVFDRECPLVEIAGSYVDKSGQTRGEARMLAIMAPIEGFTLFIKMTGPVEQVALEREHFIAFVQSLVLEP